MTWEFVKHFEGNHSCEHCGHSIKQCFVIRSGDAQMIVGSECVINLLTSESQADFKKLQTRLTRAARQWREQNPPAHDGELRSQYIERRVREMQNAFKAHHAWNKLWANRKMISLPKQAEQRLVSRGIMRPKEEIRSSITVEYETMLTKETWAIIDEFAEHHGANRFDFNRPIWEVRKI